MFGEEKIKIDKKSIDKNGYKEKHEKFGWPTYTVACVQQSLALPDGEGEVEHHAAVYLH